MALRGTRVGQAYIAVTADGDGVNEGIIDGVDEAGKEMDAKGQQHGEDYSDGFSDGFVSRIRGKIGSRITEAIDARRLGGDAGDKVGDSFVDRLGTKMRDAGDRLGAELSDRLASNPEQVRRGVDRAFDDDFIDRVGERLGTRLADSMSGAIDRQSGTLSAALSNALSGAVSGNRSGGRGGRDGGIGDIVGRLLGAGSRNNFLNLLGKSIGGIVGLTEKAAGFAGTFAANMSKAGEGAGLVARVMAGFGGAGGSGGGALLSLGAALPVLVIGLGAVALAMSVVVSIASALLAVLTALVSTIVSALVAALAVGAGALGALAAAAGLVTIAFTSMTEAQSQALAGAFRPLKEAATGLGQIMLQQMVPAFATWSKNLQVALALAEPLARVMGGAFAEAGNILTAAFSGPGMQMLLSVLADRLPGIIVSLSRAFGGFLNGIAGVFAALLPSVSRFAEYLARVASTFAAWATSARGQNAIQDFIDRAINSLKAFWGFLKAVGALLSAVLFNPKGQRAGNSIFDSMASSVRRFTDYISKENRLENWFKKGRRFARILGDAIEGIGKILDKLDNSKTIDVLFTMVDLFKKANRWAEDFSEDLSGLGGLLEKLVPPIGALSGIIEGIAGDSERAANAMSQWRLPDGMLSGASALNQLLLGPINGGKAIVGPVSPYITNPNFNPGGGGNLDDLIDLGNYALNNTYESNGGYMPDPKDKGPKYTQFEGGPASEWINPYAAWAESLAAKSREMADEIRRTTREARAEISEALIGVREMFADMFIELGKSLTVGVQDAVQSTDYKAIGESFSSLIESASASASSAMDQAFASADQTRANARAANDQMVGSARAAVDAARQRVGAATTPKELKAAKAELNRAEQDLALAVAKGRQIIYEADVAAQNMINQAKASGDAVGRANAILAGQAVFTYENALNLTRGMKVEGATLADYAEARRWAAESLATANARLAEALSIRDNYATSVADSIRNFGTLLNAQAKVINGVQQALTTNDIVDSMQDRLDKVRQFQSNLRLLLAQGLSDSAYKQLVDAGVENGGAYAQALVDGGQGGISQVNALTDQFDALGEELGLSASNQLYQAGVDAAQGLVDGLLSLSEELDSAAAKLGEAIGQAIRRELGIASPSRVLMAMMDDVGDGAVIGLDNQHGKVDAASARLSTQIAVSPEVANYAASQGESPRVTSDEESVSGNADGTQYAGKIRDLIIHTPTENPHAVATEVLDEIVEVL